MSIAICIPSRGWTSIQWALALRELRSPEPCTVTTSTLPVVDVNCERLAEDALAAGAERVLILADDVPPTPDLLEKLCAAQDDLLKDSVLGSRGVALHGPIVCAPYSTYLAAPDGTHVVPALYHRLPNGAYAPRTQLPGGRLIPVDGAAGGAMLVHASLLKALSKPWFHWRPGSVSEDMHIQAKAREELGVLTYAHLGAWQPHLKLGVLDRGDYRPV